MNRKKQIVPPKSKAAKDLKAYTWVTSDEAVARAKETIARVGLPKELDELMKKGK